MKYLKLRSLLFVAMLGSLFVSCEETADVDEYDNWEKRNTEYINTISKEASANTDGKWKRILSFKLNEKDVNGNYFPHGNDCYVYCHKEKEGTGTKHPSASILVNYRGRLIPTENHPEGLVFDESYKGELNLEGENTSQPIECYLSSFIVGWQTALPHMVEGDIWRIYIPAKLAYDSKEETNIPAHSTLIFDINLVKVIK